MTLSRQIRGMVVPGRGIIGTGGVSNVDIDGNNAF
jgi:hypothetical protein